MVGRPAGRRRTTTTRTAGRAGPEGPQARLLLPRRQPRRRTSATTDNVVSAADVWVSDLADRHAHRVGQGPRRRVRPRPPRPASRSPARRSSTWVRQNNGGWSRRARPAKTDKNGLFTRRRRGATAATSSSPATRASSSPPSNDYSPTASPTSYRPHDQTVFFTDRSLYRPGQTIQFKGICLRVDQDKDNYETLAEPHGDRRLQRPERQGDRPAADADATTTARSAAASPRRATG